MSGVAPKVSRRSTWASRSSPVASAAGVPVAVGGAGVAVGPPGAGVAVLPGPFSRFLGWQAARAAHTANRPEAFTNWRRLIWGDMGFVTTSTIPIHKMNDAAAM